MCVFSFTWLGFNSRLNWASVWLWICRFCLGRWARAAHESSALNLTLLSSQASRRQGPCLKPVPRVVSGFVRASVRHRCGITAPGSVCDISAVWPRITICRGHLRGGKVLNPALCVFVVQDEWQLLKKHLNSNTGHVCSKNDLVCEPQPSIFTDSLNSHFKTHEFTHQSKPRCKLLMLRATVSFVKSEQSGPLSPAAEIRLPTCMRAPLLLCLLLFHDGVALHLDTYRQLPGCTEEIQGGFLRRQASAPFFCYGPLLADTVATTSFMWLPENTPNCQCYTLTGCYYRCTVLCVHAESDSSFSLPECTPE